MKLAAFLPMLMSDFTDAAFTAKSLNYVAKQCVKGFPTYPELHNHLRAWWRERHPVVALPAPPPPEPRQPPTEAESAYVRACVQRIFADMRSPSGEPDERAPRPHYLTPEQLDIVNPLPQGRKRADQSDRAMEDRR